MERRGGQRPGAGRKKGSVNQNKIALDEIKKQIHDGEQLAPVEVMIYIMNKNLEDGKMDIALDAASKAAPYLHAKLVESKTEITSFKRPDQMTEDELEIFTGNSESS